MAAAIENISINDFGLITNSSRSWHATQNQTKNQDARGPPSRYLGKDCGPLPGWKASNCYGCNGPMAHSNGLWSHQESVRITLTLKLWCDMQQSGIYQGSN